MKKEPIKTKKVTIDDLAGMVARGFESVHSEIGEVKKDIIEVKKEISEVKKDVAEVKRDITEVKDNLASTRGDVLAMGDRFTLKYEFYDLSTRVGLLEQKVKTKK